jgi:hypothetical protein
LARFGEFISAAALRARAGNAASAPQEIERAPRTDRISPKLRVPRVFLIRTAEGLSDLEAGLRHAPAPKDPLA